MCKESKKFISLILLFVFMSFNSLFIPSVSFAMVTVQTVQEANKKIAAGYFHSLALTPNGCITAWGYNDENQCNIPTKAKDKIITVTAGSWHSIALNSTGKVFAWGDNLYGQCDVPKGLNKVIAIAAGERHSLALKSDGTVIAWGHNNFNQCNVPKDLNNVIAITAGSNHSLALKSDGTVIAWGKKHDSQCDVPEDLCDVITITAGDSHSLALKSDGTVIAWGLNNYNQCDVPEDLNDVIAIAAGGFHSLALKANGKLIGWGIRDEDFNHDRQYEIPATVQNDVVAIAAGQWHSLALKSDGNVVAWGDNGYGQCIIPKKLNLGITTVHQNISLTIGQKKATVNGKPNTMDVAPYLDPDSGKAMIPLRYVSESLGAQVDWNSTTKQVIIKDRKKEITLSIDSNMALINGKKTKLNCTPCIQAPGRTFISLEFIRKTLEAKVDWNDTIRNINISR